MKQTTMVLQHASQLYNDSPFTLVLSVAVLLPLAVWSYRVFYPTYDPREPPPLWPKVPFFGHAYSIFREGGGYFGRLYKSTGMPICTLPVLGDKVYVINSITMISAALRCPNLSFDPFMVIFSKNALAASDEAMARFNDPEFIPLSLKPFVSSMQGKALQDVVDAALRSIAGTLNQLGTGGGVVEIPHIGDWLTQAIAEAVTGALYGRNNPIVLGRLDDLWEFDRNITVLMVGIAPGLLAPKAIAARGRIKAALYDFYEARHDEGPDVSAFVKNRAAAKRAMGLNAGELVTGEADIPWVSLTNTFPSLIWVFVSVFARADYAERARQEAAEATSRQGDKATIDVAKLSKQPFINACVQEVQRVYNRLCGYRRVIEDTVLRDADGREYLLKKGADAQWFQGVPHLNRDIWGPDATEFNPERFINTPPDEEKKRRGAMIPFGGGKYLCPGRKFAVTEIAGMVGAMALVFDIEGVSVPPTKAGYAGCAMAHAAWKPGSPPRVRLQRRKGWEKVELEFSVHGV